MSSTVEKVKSRLSIVDVVGSYIKLTKAGSNFKAKCPFHNEKTPSFFVSPQRESYHCFGCNRGGDIFNFVQEIEGVEFYEALKMLAQKAGVEITVEDQKTKGEREKLFDVCETAVLFFEKNLEENTQAQKYLQERGLLDKTLNTFRVGFSIDAWRGLLEHCNKQNISADILEKAGLVIKTRNKKDEEVIYDRFRSRIMFPIEDTMGRVIGFSGRIFGKDDSQAKYVNSPQTLLFDKSQALYGFSKAKEGIRKFGFAIVVEGQVDVLMSHQAGFTNTVAVSGTALTRQHIHLLKRLTENIVFAFDKDSAGLAALKRASRVALSEEINVKVAQVPEGKDPADLVLEDLRLWKDAVKGAAHIIDYLLSYYREQEKDERKYKLTVTKEVIPLVASIENKIDQAHFVSSVSRVLQVPENSVYLELKKAAADIEQPPLKETKIPTQPKRGRLHLITDQLIGIYLWQHEQTEKKSEYGIILKKLQELNPHIDYVKYLNELSNEAKSKLAFEAELCYKDSEKLDPSIQELLINLEVELVNISLSEKILEERKAEEAADETKVIEIKKQIQELINKRNDLKHSLNK